MVFYSASRTRIHADQERLPDEMEESDKVW